jgi:hypothetical protein
MDVRGSVDETIGQAVQELKAGNYRGAVALLEPLLRPRAKEKLWPQQECDVVMWLSASYRFLEDHKAALPHSQASGVGTTASRPAFAAARGGIEGAVHGASGAQGVSSGPHGHHRGAGHHGRAGPAIG